MAAFQKMDLKVCNHAKVRNPPLLTKPVSGPFLPNTSNGSSQLILLKNSDFGQNWKIFPCTELERNFGEGLG